jgi:hypothetical protein
MDASLFWGGAVVIPLVFIVLGLAIKGGVGAIFPLFGAIIAMDFSAQLASDGSIAVAYTNSTQTNGIYPSILIPTALVCLSFIIVVYRATQLRYGGAAIDGAKLVRTILLVGIMLAVAAFLLPSAYATLSTANLGNAGLNSFVSDIDSATIAAGFFGFTYISMVER